MILLTGDNGFLGRHIKTEFNKKALNFHNLNKSDADFKIDISLTIPNFICKYKTVIHCAGAAHKVPKTKRESDFIFNTNVESTKNLLLGFEKIAIPKQFVFISSISVYGLIDAINVNESNPLLAQDPYGKSKIEAERIVVDWCKKNNVIYTILRLPLVVGENPPGNLGTMIKSIKKGYYFNIAGGNAKKSMVLANDIAKFILKAAEIGGIYNLTDGIHPSFFELSKCISRKFGKSYVPNLPLFLAKILARIGDIFGNDIPINSNKLLKITSTLTFDDSKARMAIGWNPTSVLDGFKLNNNA